MGIAIVDSMRVRYVISGSVGLISSDQRQSPRSRVNFKVPCVKVEGVRPVYVTSLMSDTPLRTKGPSY